MKTTAITCGSWNPRLKDMDLGKCHDKKVGFTIAELLIVVAIIAVLTAVAIPVFNSQLEKSREAADLANARSAYTAVLTAGMTDDRSSACWQSDGTYRIDVPLRQKVDNWQTDVRKLSVGGIGPNGNDPHRRWQRYPTAQGVCTVIYNPGDDSITIDWGGGYNAAYVAAARPYQGQTLTDLKQKDNIDRIKADQTTLKAIGEEILKKGWTKNEFMNQLGILSAGSAVRIADYYQDKSGSYSSENPIYQSAGFRIESSAGFLGLLRDIGYNGGNIYNQTEIKLYGKDLTTTTYQNSLFYSDELATNRFKDYDINQTMRSIIIENIQTDKSGKITGFTIYSKAMDNQANLNDAEKKLFRISIS